MTETKKLDFLRCTGLTINFNWYFYGAGRAGLANVWLGVRLLEA
jgi:hypothetical protein